MIKQVRTPLHYKDFHCIDTACTDSCCAGWQVDVDAVSWEKYKQVEGEFGAYMHSVMVEGHDGEEGQFRLRADGRCPFLNDCGLCDMYTALGEESLCDTCTNYPRFMEDYGTLREVGLAFSCPEASRLILSDDTPMQFVLEEAEGAVKDSAAYDVMWRTRHMGVEEEAYVAAEDGDFILHREAVDQDYLDKLLICRETAFFIVQNRNFSIRDRIVLYLDYAMVLQNAIDHEEEISEVVAQYQKEAWLSKRLAILKQEQNENAKNLELYEERVPETELKYRFLPEYIAILYQDLKHCKPTWSGVLSEAEELLHKQKSAKEYVACYDTFMEEMKDRSYEYEHLMSYFIFKYFLKAYFDDDVYGKVLLSVMGFLVIRELGVCQYVKQNGVFTKQDQQELYHLYSRELEHSEENYDLIMDLLHTEHMCNGHYLMALLLEG